MIKNLKIMVLGLAKEWYYYWVRPNTSVYSWFVLLMYLGYRSYRLVKCQCHYFLAQTSIYTVKLKQRKPSHLMPLMLVWDIMHVLSILLLYRQRTNTHKIKNCDQIEFDKTSTTDKFRMKLIIRWVCTQNWFTAILINSATANIVV